MKAGPKKASGGGKRIADHKAKGWMSFEDAIAWSRNVVAARTALGLDKSLRTASAILHSTWTRFGFGAPTGLARIAFGGTRCPQRVGGGREQ